MAFVVQFVYLLTQILTIAIFARAILSWFPVSRNNPAVELLHQVTEPILGPMRRIIPTLGMIDISPLVAILVLQFIGELTFSLLG